MESFGFNADLRAATAGQAFPQSVFDHWQLMPGNPLEAGKIQDIVLNIRKRKGLAPEIPTLDRYYGNSTNVRQTLILDLSARSSIKQVFITETRDFSCCGYCPVVSNGTI
jgi:hypothetical protein